MASCIPSSSPDHDFSTFLDPPIQSSFYFDPFVPAEVEDEIKVLPNNKAYGLYSCPVSILKLSSHIISHIISLCYQFLTEYLKSWFIKDLLSLLINIIQYYNIYIYSIYRALIPNGLKALYIIKITTKS